MVLISTALNRKGKSTVSEEEKEQSQSRKGRKQAGSSERGGEGAPLQEMRVEYVDESQTMGAALKALGERVNSLEKQLILLEKTHGEMVSAVNQQAKQVQEFITSASPRLGTIFEAVAKMLTQSKRTEAPGAAAAVSFEDGIPERFADDKEHQEAWRTARIVAAELEAYYPDEVTEGILGGNFYQLLGDRIGEARETYQQGVSEKVLQECDYFSAAIEALVARKQRDLQEQDSP